MRTTIKIDLKVHKKLKKIQYQIYRDTGESWSLSDIIEDALK